MSDESLVASPVDSTTFWSGTMVADVIEQVDGVSDGIKSGSGWLVGLNSFGLSMEALTLVRDPAGYVALGVSQIVGWVIEHTRLKEPLDALAGNADLVRSYHQALQN